MFGIGISRSGEVLDKATDLDIVKKSGSWFSYDSQRIGQGKENVRTFLKENPQMADEIEHKIRENAGIISNEMMTPPETELIIRGWFVVDD